MKMVEATNDGGPRLQATRCFFMCFVRFRPFKWICKKIFSYLTFGILQCLTSSPKFLKFLRSKIIANRLQIFWNGQRKKHITTVGGCNQFYVYLDKVVKSNHTELYQIGCMKLYKGPSTLINDFFIASTFEYWFW